MKIPRNSQTPVFASAAVLLLVVLLCPVRAEAQGNQPPGEEQEAQRPQAPPPPNPQAVRALRIRFEREPPVADVQKAALKFFKVHPEKVAGYRRGAAWKALMPDLELIFNNEYGSSKRTLYDYYYKNFPYKDKENGDTTSISEHECADQTSWYFVRVYRHPEAPVTCNTYKIVIGNGVNAN